MSERLSGKPNKTLPIIALCLALLSVAAWIFCGVELIRADGKVLRLAHGELFFICLVLGGISAAISCAIFYVYLKRKEDYMRAKRDMRICTCGAKVSARFTFCPACGKAMADQSDVKIQDDKKE